MRKGTWCIKIILSNCVRMYVKAFPIKQCCRDTVLCWQWRYL